MSQNLYSNSKTITTNFSFIRNHFEIDNRPRVIADNRARRIERDAKQAKPLSEIFINKVVLDSFDIFWLGTVPSMQTPKTKVSLINDLKFFEEDLNSLLIDQEGTIEYEARRYNFRYHCKVRFSVSGIGEIDGRKTLYIFFREPEMRTIS